jgi:hypothetical protein
VFGLSVSALCRTWYALPLNCPDLTCGRQANPTEPRADALSRSLSLASTQASKHARMSLSREIVMRKIVAASTGFPFHPDAITKRMIKGWCWSRARKEMTTGEMDPACLLQAMFPPQNHLEASSRQAEETPRTFSFQNSSGSLGPADAAFAPVGWLRPIAAAAVLADERNVLLEVSPASPAQRSEVTLLVELRPAAWVVGRLGANAAASPAKQTARARTLDERNTISFGF